ncbi:MAG: DUF72 domain-containing protein [Gammaproteobacteria bacterium]
MLQPTTSWTDKTLVESGLFYPGAAKTSEARLRYYASRFPIVEVDSSYYGMPSEHNSMLWVARAPEDLRVRYQGIPPLYRSPDVTGCPAGRHPQSAGNH